MFKRTNVFLLFVLYSVKFRVKSKKLYFGFANLEKAFDKVPKEVISWAMVRWVRPKTWRQIVEKDCQASKLNKEDAIDCSRWMKLIKDV